MILYLDIITAILQMVIFLSWGDSCFKRKYSENLKIKILEIVVMTIVIESIYFVVNNGTLNNIITCIAGFFFIRIIYISNKKNALIFIFMYILLMTFPTLVIIVIQQMIKEMSDINFIIIFGRKISTILLYLFGQIWMAIYLKYKNIFTRLIKFIFDKEYSEYKIFLVFVIENLFYSYIGDNSIEIKWNKIAYNILFIIYLITLIFIIVHMSKVKRQESVIERLNDTLSVKNNELSKIKHDYGAQISYLYGLYLLKRYDSLKSEISKIKKKNKSTVSGVEINYSKVRKISEGLNNLLDRGMYLIIHEYGEIENLSISKKDLLSILENISNCIIENTHRHNLILIKTYNEFNKLKIEMKISKNKSNIQIIEDGLRRQYKRDFKREKIIKDKFKQLEEKFDKKVKIKYKYGYITEILKVNIIVK